MNRTTQNNRYNHWMHTALAAVVLCGLTLPAFAAPQDAKTAPATPAAPTAQQGRGQRRRGLALATVPIAVMDMISPLKADQKTKIQAIQDKEKTDNAAAADRAAKGAVSSKATEDIKAVLTPEQLSTVEKAVPMLSMLNQSKAIPLAALPDVKLTKDQMDKISALTDTEQTKLTGLKGAERRAKMPEVNADFKTQVEALLTADQKAAIARFESAAPRNKKKSV